MRKMLNRIFLCGFAALCFWCGSVVANPQRLEDTRVRLQEAVASARWEEGYTARDAAAVWASDALHAVGDVDAARAYLTRLKTLADDTLSAAGYSETGLADFCGEAFSAWKEWAEWKIFFIRNELSLFFGRKM